MLGESLVGVFLEKHCSYTGNDSHAKLEGDGIRARMGEIFWNDVRALSS